MKRKHKKNPSQQLVNLIRDALNNHDWTLMDIAKYLGISHIHMASLNSGARKFSGLKLEKQRALAEFLGISMVELFLHCGVLRQEDLFSQ